MNIKGLSVGPIGTNCYIVFDNNDALIIDPGEEPERILGFVNQRELTVQAILLTHAHFDHFGALEEVRKKTGAMVYLHENEIPWLSDPMMNGSFKLQGSEVTASPAEKTLVPGKIAIGAFEFTILHTPGHSPGSVSFVFEKEYFVIGGDVLFHQGIGRTDLAGGSMRELEASIRNELYALDDTYTVYPGHGPATTIGAEKKNNPFVREK
ncbi:MBL fold metallo-hydrolase [Oceanobacillus damuensis]|uniref:MBL fold metallo-hydrolase n=1 Tax=Oceanobacillus damuensis TaxID=937928 RepID=UPI00082BEA76|nr:MBL fold metallo-hydrolase [Oceanobacillus damuensis]